MIDDGELLAGLAFLARYAHPDYRSVLAVCSADVLAIRAEHKRNEIRKVPITDLELSIRTSNALTSLGLKTVDDVESFVSFKDEMILERGKRHYFGKKCLKETRALLKELGL
jgi:hypothetical protein